MPTAQVDEKTKAGIFGKEVTADFKQRVAMLKAQMRASEEANKASMEREIQRRASQAAYADAMRQAQEKAAQEQQAEQGEAEPLTANLPDDQPNTRNPLSTMGKGGPAALLTHPGGGVGPYAGNTPQENIEGMSGVPEAPPWLVSQQRVSEVGPQEVGRGWTVPMRTTRNVTSVEPNVLTQAQRQQALLERAKAIIEQRQWEQEEARKREEFGIKEGRQERTAQAKIAASEASVASSYSAIARRGIQNRIDLQRAGEAGWDRFADQLAKIGADQRTDDDKQLWESGIAALPEAERRDVLERRSVFRSQFERASEGTGTIEVYDPDSPTGTKRIRTRDLPTEGAFGKPLPGMRITSGGVTVETGMFAGKGATPSVTSQLQENVANASAGLNRLAGINASFDPKFLTYPVRVELKALQQTAKVSPARLSPESKRKLDRFAGFQTGVLNNLNLYIKDITGAQMSAQEAERLTKGMPNMSDDPFTFGSKMGQVTGQLRTAIARNQLLLNKGFGDENIKRIIENAGSLEEVWGKVSLQDTVESMQKRERALLTTTREKHKDWSEDVIRQSVADQVNREFGLGD